MADTDRRFSDVPEDAGIDGYSPSFVDVNGARTRYYDVGTGDPIVLIHGGTWKGYASANAWSLTFEHLAEQFRVLAFDRIGCGLTDNPDRPAAYVYQTDLDHAFGFLDALGLESCHLVGFSRGGGLATRMAVEDPARVRSLTINNSATLGPPVTDNAYRRSRLFQMDALGLDPTDPAYVRHYYEQYSYQTGYLTEERCRIAAYMQSQPKFELADEILAAQAAGHDWKSTLVEHMNTTRRRIEDGALEMPVHYMYGLNDLTVPPEMSMAAFGLIAESNPAARMSVLNKCGHMGFLEHPAEFSKSVADFIDWFTDVGA